MKIFGGLGNQMFQYATGVALARKNNFVIKLDTTFFDDPGKCISREYGLGVFNISTAIATIAEVNAYKQNKVTKQLQRLLPWYKRSVIQEPFYHFAPDIFGLKKNVLVEGYWQSPKYFQEIESEIRKEFSLKHELSSKAKDWKEVMKSKASSVSIHIRRGDYVNDATVSAHIGAQGIEYYNKAIEFLKNKYKDITFFVFSDDIAWAKEHLVEENMEFVSSPELKDYEEMYLMSQCSHNVIANSSFSWWGAWLNDFAEKTVIAPRVWFADGSNDTKDLIPESWIRM